ncbi:MAG: type II toxin-antitoxin system VapC family toxin [Acidobacteriaceae bacterium]
MNIYADTSFFVSLYLRGAHTPQALRHLAANPGVWFTPFHKLEFAHALAQNVFHRQISAAKADLVHTLLADDCSAGLWELVDFPQAALETGAGLARRYVPVLGTRTLDTVHVACALELKATRFWTFDQRQAKLAKAAGLKTT